MMYLYYIGYSQKILELFQGSVILESALWEPCFLGTTESPAHVAL